MGRGSMFLVVIVVAVAGVLSSIFIVDEREKALVLQFGQIKQVKTEPGLGFKIPFIQEVVRYDGRILSLDTPAIGMTVGSWSTPSRATGSATRKTRSSSSGKRSVRAACASPKTGWPRS